MLNKCKASKPDANDENILNILLSIKENATNAGKEESTKYLYHVKRVSPLIQRLLRYSIGGIEQEIWIHENHDEQQVVVHTLQMIKLYLSRNSFNLEFMVQSLKSAYAEW